MKKFILVLFCIALTVSCKEEEPKPEQVSEVKNKPNKLEVKINCKSDKKDVLQCVFNRIEFVNNREANYIITDKIQANKEFQTFNFEMFNDNIVTLVQLKLGKVPKNLEVKDILITYGDKKVIVRGSEVDKYFATNPYVTYNKESQTLTTKVIKGKHSPVLTLRQGFIKRLFNLN